MNKVGVVILIGSVLAAICLSGCGYRVSQLRLSDQSYPPKPSSYDVPILTLAPERSYETLARIYVNPRNPGDVSNWSLEQTMRPLKKKALELGADAVILESVYNAPVGTVGMGGFNCTGLAIRWKD